MMDLYLNASVLGVVVVAAAVNLDSASEVAALQLPTLTLQLPLREALALALAFA